MGGGGLGGGVLLLLRLSVLAGGTRLDNAGLPGAGDMAAPKANGRPAIAAGGSDEEGDRGAYGYGDPPISSRRRMWGALPDSSQRLTGRCRRGALVISPSSYIRCPISLIRRTTISRSVPGIAALIISFESIFYLKSC